MATTVLKTLVFGHFCTAAPTAASGPEPGAGTNIATAAL
jgi:hypothetical protein